jgi:hypothetical protein
MPAIPEIVRPEENSDEILDFARRQVGPRRARPPAGTAAQSGKTRPNFSDSVRKSLLAWLKAHRDHPYAEAQELARLAEQNQLSIGQVRTFFVNNRSRVLGCGQNRTRFPREGSGGAGNGE